MLGLCCCAQASHCAGFSFSGTWALGHTGSVVMVHGFSCPEACGIFLDQGLNPCPLHWHHWTTREVCLSLQTWAQILHQHRSNMIQEHTAKDTQAEN